ncbi:DUF4157 domain-containing protein [Actinomadura sp. DC4]|uniref:eCIS core domain-containing protein n=1 Tax=Actinomadura sp. DC4 TaxID=3055069 RepID=UPI0025B0BDF8|nr:DUF4157 domain-containing protein [Actinomadura sp. DC4]MDN3354890.1 DUF4157 domain-containing protein [Actinomadura sp. DC4]
MLRTAVRSATEVRRSPGERAPSPTPRPLGLLRQVASGRGAVDRTAAARAPRLVGNRGMGQLLAQEGLPSAVGGAGDRREQEADRTAERVAAKIGTVGPGPAVPGRLPDDVRAPLEQAFGADFGDVRIHLGDRADRLGGALQASAFTAGTDVHFARDAYDPGSPEGLRTLAHELTHVTQQRTSSPVIQRQLVRVTTTDSGNRELYQDTRTTYWWFEPVSQDWYRLEDGTLVTYYPQTAQYSLADYRWWDPVAGRTFTVDNGAYLADDGSGHYLYDGTFYQRTAPPVTVEHQAAAAWLEANFATSRSTAFRLIQAARYVSKEHGWTMLDNWNLVYPEERIEPVEAGFDPANRERDLAEQERPSSPIRTQTRVTSRSYKLGKAPAPGTNIVLPSDREIRANVDFYWRGKGDEMGGGAADRKAEKHDIAPEEAYKFARANSRRWFVEKRQPNHVIFHDYTGDPERTVTMAVWDWTNGQMVTFYSIDSSRAGKVGKYLRDKGMP